LNSETEIRSGEEKTRINQTTEAPSSWWTWYWI